MEEKVGTSHIFFSSGKLFDEESYQVTSLEQTSCTHSEAHSICNALTLSDES